MMGGDSTRSRRPWLAHYDPGVPSSIRYPEQPVFRFLEEAAHKYPDRPCTLLRGQAISFAEMDQITDRLAGALARLGVRRGDRVGIFMPNTPQFVMAFYAILKAGGVVVASNPLYSASELARQIDDSGMKGMFVMDGLLETARAAEALSTLGALIVATQDDGTGQWRDQTAGRGSGPHRAERDAGISRKTVRLQELLERSAPEDRPTELIGADDTALFQYSGGTTGVSKAAVASHRGVVSNTIQFRRWLSTLREEQEIMLMAIPLYHAYGMVAGMSLAIALGAGMALVPNARDLQSVLDAITAYRPTVFPGVPTLYNAIGNHPEVLAGAVDLHSLRVCISGSTALLRKTKEQFEHLSGGRICEGYGLSEAPVVTHCNPLLGTNKIGSIGLPMPDVDCLIVDPENPERRVGQGKSGELILRGPQVMTGYHNMPQETATALRSMGDGQPWLFTGDIVRMDEDGYFYIVDRKKELIKPGGFQVWPREVEEVIASHPSVLEVGVAGVADPVRGEVVKAWVVLKPGLVLTVDELLAWCRAHLAYYRVPGAIEFRADLPKSTVGKVLRRELVRQHQAGQSRPPFEA
jgi:long-chain acyl-CoA synthetase